MNIQTVKTKIDNELNKDVEVIKRFTSGMSNYTYLIKVDNVLYTYRIPGKNSEVFIDREIEYSNTNIIKKLNLNCENVYFNTINGHKMALFIEGDDLSTSNVDYNEVAYKLKELHNSGFKAVNDYNKLEKLNHYESLVKTKHTEEYFTLKNKLINLLEEHNDIELVFCHGDAQKANWIKSNSLYLLDWEYSANNDPYYDIACFGNIDFNDAIILLECYLNEKPTQIQLNRLIVNRMFQCMQWYNVALYKEEIGLSVDLNINFKEVSLKYLKLAKTFLDMIKKK